MTAPLARYPLHAFFTTSTLDTVTADKTHRAHAVIELVNSVQKSSVLAHLPTGVFTANAACLVLAVMAFSLTRAVATMAGNGLARVATATIRRKLVSVPARISPSARRITLHLPEHGPWEKPWTALLDQNFRPRQPAPPDPPADIRINRSTSGTPGPRDPDRWIEA